MKKTFYIKEVLLQVSFITAILLIANTRKIQIPLETIVVIQEHNNFRTDNQTQEKDTQFIANIAEIKIK